MKKHTVIKLLIAFLILVTASTYWFTLQGEAQTSDVPASWWKKDKDDFPELKGGPEKFERMKRQQPVDLNTLQQRYPDTFILRGPTNQNRIALTFDDGPDSRYTNQVLDILNEYNVPATFFLLGSRAVAYPEIVERINNEGHIIGNHTYFHPNLVDEGDLDTLEREVTRTEDAINNIVGYRTSLFRPPYGFLYNELVEKLADMQYRVIAWSLDSLDWQEEPSDVIANRVIDEIEPGAIILMHDGADWDGDRTFTIEALREIIPTLQAQGYEFVTVPDLVGIPYAK
ncbi:polysaccharide deacetylase family protein [Alkalihalobacillus pseudalcaliphilus]|uniref:polysaccharide deacetylase family protein n=1 Tax=Alkalihalobacillus pseudalcaliphilus TaxID=79884 RepID=UPI00064DC14E|nr:polysaccharide deacetylase family protein [Alkalihalobacillus pseudalcaliphilus]KMK75208.1 chitooligosaccharide deacetylase [Alkalihalobacillus pseudalcaliphilus]